MPNWDVKPGGFYRMPCNPRCQKMRPSKQKQFICCATCLFPWIGPEMHPGIPWSSIKKSKNHASSLFVFEKSGQFMSVFHFSTFRLFGFYGFSGSALENPLLFDFWSFRVCPGSAKTEKSGAPPPTHPAEGGVIQTNQQHWWSNRKLPLFWNFCGLVAAVRTVKSVWCAVLCSWRGCQEQSGRSKQAWIDNLQDRQGRRS